ncbi:MAG: BREX-4 system phosphatase PglZ, partial [Lachnospiraceae bacterium]|nr:BREX-4 system phosphatase PglZ [Lachnospiraceae bacterium]
KDEFPQIDTLFHDLETKQGTTFITGISSFLKLHGEQKLRKFIGEILSMTTAGHVVVITYQCHKYMDFKDPRLQTRIVVLDGEEQTLPEIYFSSPGLSLKDVQTINGIDSFAVSVESISAEKLLVITSKEKADYPNALYRIVGLSKAYDALLQKDPKTSELNEVIGTDEQWKYALGLFEEKPGWVDVIDSEFGNHMTLEIHVQNYNRMAANRLWLYYIGLKLFGAKNNWCLNYASSRSVGLRDLITNVYRGILNKNIKDANFWDCYDSRKMLLNQIGNPSAELTAYCKVVVGKGKNAIYYLTDNTEQEKEVIFTFLDQYGMEYKRDELMGILKRVYPDLFAYLQPYRFRNELLDNYFQDYKYQKVINKILPDFETIVLEQAEKREYNLILEPRSSKIEKLSTKDSLLYFMDAMGVEYLGYIMMVCRELLLNAKITVCRCELPSITSRNKEFLEPWDEKQIVSIKDIDDIKHHGKFDYDYYSNSKLPLHLIKEMEIIHDTLEKIRNKLISGDTIKRAVMIADHGASRLAVLHDTENVWEMEEKGQHSGRCCPKSDVDVQPDYATDAGDFWALANYDRFRGGRKANVEVHGGATLEEICVPIIELTYSDGKTEVHLMPVNAEAVDFTGALEIEVSFRKKAALKVFMTAELPDVSITVDGKNYEAESLGNGFYRVDMLDLRKPGTYSVDVYSGDNIVAEKLTLIVKREGQREKDLL